MNREEAEEYAEKMSYREAVSNALMGKGIPFRKATLTKLHRLLDIIEPMEKERPRFVELEPSKDGVKYKLKTLIEIRNDIKKNPDMWFNRGITLCGDLARMVFNAIDKYIEMETKGEKKTTRVWLKVDDEEPIAYDCSGCGAMVSKKTRFCPGCGAKMEVDNDKRGV